MQQDLIVDSESSQTTNLKNANAVSRVSNSFITFTKKYGQNFCEKAFSIYPFSFLTIFDSPTTIFRRSYEFMCVNEFEFGMEKGTNWFK